MFSILLISIASAFQENLQVHLIPHSHNDAGWTETFESYYIPDKPYGGVKRILDTVFDQLRKEPDRTFTYSSIAFFKRWWDEQIEVKKEHVRELVKQGRFVFVNGGWTEHDEATIYYQDLLDNVALGHKFLLSEFGIRPTVGWLPDSFGHSAANADLYPKMGMSSLFFSRISYFDKNIRKATKNLETIWTPDCGTGKPSDLFTHIFSGHYGSPDGFQFDTIHPGYWPIYNDTKWDHIINLQNRTLEFVERMREQAEFYQSNHLMVPMGDDFTYSKAREYYRNIDLLIQNINQQPFNMTLIYSTPSDYIQAVQSEKIQLSTKSDDFFPYATEGASFWTGFYTSRPAFKKYVRTCGSLLRAAQNLISHKIWLKQVGSLQAEEIVSQLSKLKEAMSLVQHHDAVSGTARQTVVQDYIDRLKTGLDKTVNMLLQLVQTEVLQQQGILIDYIMCPQENINICGNQQHDREFNVAIFNPRFHNVTQMLSIPLNWTAVQVYDDLGQQVPCDLVEYPSPFELQENQKSQTNLYRLYFPVSISSMSVRNYRISQRRENDVQSFKNCQGKDWEISSFDGTILSYDETILKNRSSKIKFAPKLGHYEANTGDKYHNQKSGAYVFRTQTWQSTPISWPRHERMMFCGQVVCQLYVKYSSKKGAQLFTLPQVNVDDTWLHVETYVNSINIDDGVGKDVIASYKTDITNAAKFYTDSNGMGINSRSWKHLYTKVLSKERTARNYYPITSQICVNGTVNAKDTAQLTIVVDRSQGGTCRPDRNQGTIDLMIHRRILTDDFKGLGEELDERDPWDDEIGLRVVTSHAVLLHASEELIRYAEDYYNEPLQVFFGKQYTESEVRLAEPSIVPELPAHFNAHWRPIDATSSILRLQNTSREKSAMYNIYKLLSYYGEQYFIVQLGLSENQTMQEIIEDKNQWNQNTSQEYKNGYFATKPILDYVDEHQSGTHSFLPNEIKSFLIVAKP